MEGDEADGSAVNHVAAHCRVELIYANSFTQHAKISHYDAIAIKISNLNLRSESFFCMFKVVVAARVAGKRCRELIFGLVEISFAEFKFEWIELYSHQVDSKSVFQVVERFDEVVVCWIVFVVIMFITLS